MTTDRGKKRDLKKMKRRGAQACERGAPGYWEKGEKKERTTNAMTKTFV